MVEVLPAPLGPWNATISAEAMVRWIRLTACTEPKLLCTPLSSIAGGSERAAAWASPGTSPIVLRAGSPPPSGPGDRDAVTAAFTVPRSGRRRHRTAGRCRLGLLRCSHLLG